MCFYFRFAKHRYRQDRGSSQIQKILVYIELGVLRFRQIELKFPEKYKGDQNDL